MSRDVKRLLALFVPLLLLLGCRQDEGPPLFSQLTPRRTGITFANTITTSDSVNILTNVYLYNGGGVAVGDIDNDGLPDIVFAGNMVSSRLYLNKGNMRFEDITESAGVTTHVWASGVSLVDINDDGYLDIYVSMSGPPWAKPEETRNLLFVNNGNRTFTESAATYGIDDPGFTTHAAFFDYDRDGDLDLFLLGNSPQDFARSQAELHPAGIRRHSAAGYDRLYRNNGDGTFTDVSQQTGILTDAQFGLGVVVSDFNRDGWPDLYISNDDIPNDVLYINNRDGTFTDKAATWLKHTSFAGMGIDAADFNNDGWPDIMQTDMMPEDLPSRKRMTGAITYSEWVENRRRGQHSAYNLNTLQLSNGMTSTGDVVFSEIARLAGVAYTHWSWSALFGDVDNDGYKDLFVTNGYPKAVTDFDYQTAMFRLRRSASDSISPQRLEILKALRTFAVSNYMFRNNGDLTFSNTTKAWGLEQPGFSYGAALADLNNDGRLDLIVNNIDAPASIYENGGSPGDVHHYLDIALRGDPPNLRGIGSTLMVVAGGQHQYVYHTPYHGYNSSVEAPAHFGLGAATRVDSLIITWPDGRSQTFTDLAVDQVLTVRQADATPQTAGTNRPIPDTRYRFFQPADPARTLRYKHEETEPPDFSVQPLLPEQLSKLGPPLAVADVNGDGRADVFIGGAAGIPGRLFLQQADGRFVESVKGQPWEQDKDHTDWGALFFDANGDGLPDLYVASGGYHLSPISALLQDRLYVNHGGGRFVRDTQALPPMHTATGVVVAGDFTGDGKPDLFVGGRLVPRNYPYPTRSYLLRNDGGDFTDVTEEMAPELVTPGGRITAAVWLNVDGDGRLDLVTAGDWMPLQYFRNEGTRFRNVTASMGLDSTRGRWFRLATGDFNHDGRPDLVAGNLGLNHSYTTSAKSRLGVYAGDFTGGFSRPADVILTQEIAGIEYPFLGLATLGRYIYTLGLKFSTYGAFSHASLPDVLSTSQMARALHYQTDTFASLYLQNNGNGGFTVTPLPTAAQIAPIRGILPFDVDGDGNLDLIVAGNLYDTEPNIPPADAGNGLWLRGDGHGHFTPVPPIESGFLAPRNVTGLALIKTPAGTAVLVTNHGDSLSAFVIRRR